MDRLRHGPRAALALLLILAGATVGVLAAGRDGGAQAAPGLRANLLPGALDGAAAPRIALADQHGRRVDSTRLGRPYLVTFLYTHCVDACPLIGAEIADALDRLGPRADDVAILAVSVDPRGDTPAAARAWVAQRRLPRQFHYLLGSAARLTPVWRDWYVIGAGGGLADPRTHDASVWLVDRSGRLRGRWSGAEPIAPGDIAHDLRVLLGQDHQPAASRPSSSA